MKYTLNQGNRCVQVEQEEVDNEESEWQSSITTDANGDEQDIAFGGDASKSSKTHLKKRSLLLVPAVVDDLPTVPTAALNEQECSTKRFKFCIGKDEEQEEEEPLDAYASSNQHSDTIIRHSNSSNNKNDPSGMITDEESTVSTLLSAGRSFGTSFTTPCGDSHIDDDTSSSSSEYANHIALSHYGASLRPIVILDPHQVSHDLRLEWLQLAAQGKKFEICAWLGSSPTRISFIPQGNISFINNNNNNDSQEENHSIMMSWDIAHKVSNELPLTLMEREIHEAYQEMARLEAEPFSQRTAIVFKGYCR